MTITSLPSDPEPRPTISICLCTWNGERYIKELLDSLARQTLRPDELVVCDDASVDGTLQILNRFSSDAPFPVRLEHNASRLGLIGNFERAMSLATGEILAFCDQDDVWYPDKLSVVADVFSFDSRLVGVFHDADVIESDGRPVGQTVWQLSGFDLHAHDEFSLVGGLKYLIRHPIVAGHTLVFKASERPLLIPFSPSANYDSWVSRLLAASGHLRPLHKTLVAHRVHDANAVGMRRKSGVAHRLRDSQLAGRTFAKEAAGLLDLRARLESHLPDALDDETKRQLDAKIVHMRARATLSEQGLFGAITLGQELATGRYDMYSNALSSALLDTARIRFMPPASHRAERHIGLVRPSSVCTGANIAQYGLANCPVCHSNARPRRRWEVQDRMFRLERQYLLFQCASCRSVWVANPPDDIDAYYLEGYYSFHSASYGSHVSDEDALSIATTMGQQIKRRLQTLCQQPPRRSLLPRLWDVDGYLIKSVEAPHAAVLDIGCGDGAALERYRNAGWATHGIEPNESAAERARAMGHDVVSGSFPAAAPSDARFDVVRMRHVIEHLPDPLQALDRGFDLVSPGGMLYVELPNLGGALARLSGKHYWGLEPPRHLVIPHRDKLLERLRASPIDEVVVSAYSRGDGIARTCMIWSHHDRRRHARWYLGDEPTSTTRLLGRASEPLAMIADAVGQGDLLRIVARVAATASPRANRLVEPTTLQTPTSACAHANSV